MSVSTISYPTDNQTPQSETNTNDKTNGHKKETFTVQESAAQSIEFGRMGFAARGKFGTVALVVQIVFLVLFAALGEYDESAKPDTKSYESSTLNMYPMFQDVHVMIFIGFGFLMTFLKRYGYSAVGINLLVAALAAQWAIIVRGFINDGVFNGNKFPIGIEQLLTADFAAATVLISFGALLGKTTPLQLLIMTLIEIVLAQINEWIGYHVFYVLDVGESMFVHAFGAYFGLAVARVLFNEEVENTEHEGPVYHSDVFSMIGTVFLWIFWPSFNGGAASGDEQHRAIVNTYLSLCACVIVTFAVSGFVDKRGKFSMDQIQNATLAGGVAVGTTANAPLQPWGALLIGCVAGALSVIGFKYITPFMNKKLKIHDTCGVHNLHGMPGVLAGIAGIVVAAIASHDSWGDSVFQLFPMMAPKANTSDYDKFTMMLDKNNNSVPIVTLHEWEAGKGRSAGEQAAYQVAALAVTLVFAIVGGVITGFLLKIPVCRGPEKDHLFDDRESFNIPDEGYPGTKYTVNGSTEARE
ncbi:hypothetical protein FSP39_000149 [Pinctada imbricata]|uniref:Ammonium transporter AmtB-like domain-containing protein n=1 Tax=Pinctada imbricata TaxID=66713 RepID=A0AA89BLH2_PINIB|nr:hypothetical protein FSP39_000149 [Pinctada imbricata]